ncbi:hypothetical protein CAUPRSCDRAFT_12697, partial [Caulochytrium protostelioides]
MAVREQYDLPGKDILDPAILWFMKASLNWPAIAQAAHCIMSRRAMFDALVESDEKHRLMQWALVEATAHLAHVMGSSILKMGIMYDHILDGSHFRSSIVLVKVIDHEQGDIFKRSGYCWALPRKVEKIMAQQLGVNVSQIRDVVGSVRPYINAAMQPLKPEYYVGSLVVKSNLSGFHIMVPKNAHSNIPMAPVSEATWNFLRQHSDNLREVFDHATVNPDELEATASALHRIGLLSDAQRS